MSGNKRKESSFEQTPILKSGHRLRSGKVVHTNTKNTDHLSKAKPKESKNNAISTSVLPNDGCGNPSNNILINDTIHNMNTVRDLNNEDIPIGTTRTSSIHINTTGMFKSEISSLDTGDALSSSSSSYFANHSIIHDASSIVRAPLDSNNQEVNSPNDDSSQSFIDSMDTNSVATPYEHKFVTENGMKRESYEVLMQPEMAEQYLLVESALTVLKQQLAQAEKDLNTLMDAKKAALNNPLAFVESLLNKTYPKLPKPQRIVSIPQISLAPSQSRSLRKSAPATTLNPITPSRPSLYKPQSYGVIPARDTRDISSPFMTPDVPASRSSTRPASRPSSLPSSRPSSPDCPNIKSRNNSIIETDHSSGRPPPKFADPSRVKTSGAFYSSIGPGRLKVMVPQPETISSSDEDDFLETLDDDLKQTDEYKELMELKKKLEVTQGGVPKTNRSKTVHHGFTCDSCTLEPIVGVRWKCEQCPIERQIDLCDDCYKETKFETIMHKSSHTFQKIEQEEEGISAPADEYHYLGW